MVRISFLIAILVGSALGQDKPRRIGSIDFYGYAGLNVDQIKSALPIQVGDPFPGGAETKKGINKAVTSTIGRSPTDVVSVCCDAQGNVMIYIGLPGSSIKHTKLNPVPKANIHFPPEIVELYERTMDASGAALLRGNAQEDTSQGFALSISDPELRAKQLEVRAYAIEHEKLIRDVLNSSSDAHQRVVAAFMLEYTRTSNQQISSLVRASHDADETVRNNATRALGVLASSSPKVAARIPAGGFITMLSSGSWTDRNKAGFVISSLTRSREPKLLRQLRSDALISLIEMAHWRDPAHSSNARIVLGRIAGIPEERLVQLVSTDKVDEIIKELRLNEREN